MKPFPVLVLFLTLGCLAVYGQTGTRNSSSVIRTEILVPEGEFQKIDGRFAHPDRNSRYTVDNKVQIPGNTKASGDRVIRNADSPVFLEKKRTSLKSEAGTNPENLFYRFLEIYTTETGVVNPGETFRVIDLHTDKLGITHI